MDKKASIELWILGFIAVLALVGLILFFSGKLTGLATGPMTRSTFPTSEPFRIENPGGYACGCDGVCAYNSQIVRASPTVTSAIAEGESTCRTMLESICGGQPILRFNFGCGTR